MTYKPKPGENHVRQPIMSNPFQIKSFLEVIERIYCEGPVTFVPTTSDYRTLVAKNYNGFRVIYKEGTGFEAFDNDGTDRLHPGNPKFNLQVAGRFINGFKIATIEAAKSNPELAAFVEKNKADFTVEAPKPQP
ncbi:TPA: hypothetical protein HA238_06405 [Candidatus Micrarchaeota archaeon]|nr:hypothetical protein [Candidatus Micrarchaeota archaeon]